MDVRDRSIYTPNIETGAVLSSRLREAGTSGASEPASAPFGNDSSRLSAAAMSLMQTMQLPDVRENRIVGLQQQIAAGNYQISSPDVADAILRNIAG